MTTVASQEKPWPVVYDQRDSQSVKVTLNTNTEIVYTGGNRRWLNATVQLYARYSIVWLAIMIALQSTFVCFVSTGGIVKSLNITPVDDYKQRRWYFVRSSFTFEPSKPKQRWHSKAQQHESLPIGIFHWFACRYKLNI